MMKTSDTAGKESSGMPDIFSYLDYRIYLRDLCAEKKRLNPHFSYRYLSQKIQIQSAGFFSWVLMGKRNLSERLVLKLARFFKLNSSETAYFTSLVAFNQAATHEERRFAFDRILQMRRGTVRQVEADQCTFYRTWYYPALRELVAVEKVTDETIPRIAALMYPPVKPEHVGEALSTLCRLGLIVKDENGQYHRTDQVISSRQNIPLVALHDYQLQALDLAKAAFNRFERSERELSTITMSIDDQAYLGILERLGTLRREIMEIARSVKNPSRVMQLNLQFFPLSQKKKAGGNV